MEVKESKRSDQYRTFRAKVRIKTKNPMSGDSEMIWIKNFFFKSWESCAGIAGIGCTIEQAPKLFPTQFHPEILSLEVDVLNSANDPRLPLYSTVFKWSREPEADGNEIKVKLSDLLSRERRQIKDLEFLRVA